MAVVRGAGSPAGQQAQGVLGGRPRLGGVGEEALTGIGGQRERLECQFKVPSDRVVDEFHAGGVDPDVVGGPSDPELVAAGGQLPDQVRQLPVVGFAAGLGAQQGDRVVGHFVPVAEEPARVRVEEDEPGVVGRPGRIGVDRREQRIPEGTAALVTGASSGIGAATARRLAGHGASVALVARRRDRLEALAAEIGKAGGTALAVEADITDRTQAEDAVQQTAGRFGRLDTLVNNAGLMLLGPVAGADPEEWDRMIAINVQ